MKWGLAAVCFALMVSLAVATAAIKTVNVTMRARLYQHELAITDREIDLIRLQPILARETSREKLAVRWQRFIDIYGERLR